jgi:hypothetical protein
MNVSYNKVQLKSVLWFHLHLYPVFSLCFFFGTKSAVSDGNRLNWMIRLKWWGLSERRQDKELRPVPTKEGNVWLASVQQTSFESVQIGRKYQEPIPRLRTNMHPSIHRTVVVDMREVKRWRYTYVCICTCPTTGLCKRGSVQKWEGGAGPAAHVAATPAAPGRARGLDGDLFVQLPRAASGEESQRVKASRVRVSAR